jgi:hypothetical protein
MREMDFAFQRMMVDAQQKRHKTNCMLYLFCIPYFIIFTQFLEKQQKEEKKGKKHIPINRL